ncbi:hypothetical protein HK098_006549 [Nowakowskiella sp. JEL0407]|nr:hypothetical protein HK098_006549 [Nowakowskiella sp. JEL0407]
MNVETTLKFFATITPLLSFTFLTVKENDEDVVESLAEICALFFNEMTLATDLEITARVTSKELGQVRKKRGTKYVAILDIANSLPPNQFREKIPAVKKNAVIFLRRFAELTPQLTCFNELPHGRRCGRMNDPPTTLYFAITANP